MKEALLLVDIQNDYFSGGRMELPGMEEAGAVAAALLDEFRGRGDTTVHIQHISMHKGSTFFIPNTDGSLINSCVEPRLDDIIVTKNFPNSFRETELLSILKKMKIEKLTICGAMSHMCIDATTRAAADYGFNCTVVENACATRALSFNGNDISSKSVHSSFMAALGAAYAQVITK